uniref:Histone acetyltransferase HPA2 and related acetyltransferases n=1 Tax=uncultured nuHF2 cluster bacterium HF0500_39O04 TaxID=723590 RepID=E7C6A9_9BACT|nr:histone acetyltransferase HPA2 and related acetyltransferases [uncultured nuHF2 cluster bacterium HF0500_39O04]
MGAATLESEFGNYRLVDKDNPMKIRQLDVGDFDGWLKLYEFYAQHYKIELFPDGIKTTWEWLMDENHPTKGMVVGHDNELIGLAHYRAMPSPLRGENIGFIDDIVVAPSARGMGAAEQLINAVKDEGQKSGWKIIRWITRDNNYRARAVYDKVSEKSDWNVYEMKCD